MTIDMQRTFSSALMQPAWVAVAVLALPGQASAQTRELATRGELLDRVAAIVNDGVVLSSELDAQVQVIGERLRQQKRSEERRVGKACRGRWGDAVVR